MPRSAKKLDIAGKIAGRLAGQADHDAGTGLIADAAQRLQTFQAGFERLSRRMDPGEQVRVRRFDAQQVAMRACVVKRR